MKSLLEEGASAVPKAISLKQNYVRLMVAVVIFSHGKL